MYDANAIDRQEWVATLGKQHGRFSKSVDHAARYILRLMFVVAVIVLWLNIDTIVAVFVPH